MSCKKCKGKGYTIKRTPVVLRMPVVILLARWLGFASVIEKPGTVEFPLKCPLCDGTGN